jgi:hypothetical protein
MKRYTYSVLILLCFLVGVLQSSSYAMSAQAAFVYQQPTVDVPTVTSSPIGSSIVVNTEQEQINVRSGPDVIYPTIGVMVTGQTAPALGRSPGGNWIQIRYPGVQSGIGWVWSFLVTLKGDVPVVEPPPTPTPPITPTIDPTLAAQFLYDFAPTHLPTFTAPPPLIIPTMTVPAASRETAGVPIGFIIIGMGVVGLFGLMISLLRGR